MWGVFILNNVNSYEVVNLCNLTIQVHGSIVHLLHIKKDQLIYEFNLKPAKKFYFYRCISAGKIPLQDQAVEWVFPRDHSVILLVCRDQFILNKTKNTD